MLEAEVFEKMTLHAKQSLSQSKALAGRYGATEVLPIHLLCAIGLEKGSLGANMLADLGIRSSALQKYLEKNRPVKTRGLQKNNPEPPFSSQIKSVLTRAYAIAGMFQYSYIGTEHLIYATLETADRDIDSILKKNKIEPADLENLLTPPNQGLPSHGEFPKEFGGGETSLTKQLQGSTHALPYLEQFCTNLNKEAMHSNELVIGRDKELQRLLDILGRKGKNNPLLIGDPGVGKTALVQGLAQRIVAGDVAPNLADKTIYALDLALVVAGTTFRGEFESRLKEIIREAAHDGKAILFIDEVHGIVGAGNSQGALDAANILKPALSSGKLQCIGATTYAEYKKYIEKDPALVRRFQPLQIPEPSVKDTVAIIEKTKHFYEKFHHVSIPKEVISAAVELSVRYINDRFLPDKAIDLLDEAASAAKNKTKGNQEVKELRKAEAELIETSLQKNVLTEKSRYEEAALLQHREAALKKTVSQLKERQAAASASSLIPLAVADIAAVVSRTTGIPLEKISPQQSSTGIAAVENKLSQKIIGQGAAIKAIGDVLVRSASGITNPDRPLGSFLFLGPTGVGKTLTAQILAQEIFSHPRALIRIDMSEFMEKHSLAQLIGAPAGYVGFEEGGRLTEKVRHNPYSLILFDEIEKAHPDMFNILLQILEDGTLTDAQGRNVNFKNTIIILTSNLGTSQFTSASAVGFKTAKKEEALHSDFEAIKNDTLTELKKSLRPEILNRLDQIIVFSPLSNKELVKIVRAQLKKLTERLAKRDIKFSFSTAAVSFIAEKSFAPEYGARLVRKNIQDLIEAPIAKHILGGKIKDGKIKIDIKNDNIIVK